MDNKFFLSIVIPMYNEEKYIIACLESLNNQTVRDFEVIVIDDGSTDNSYKIAENYLRKRDLNYKLVRQSNQGQSAARNVGIKNSIGQYLLFLDSDDFVENTLVEKTEESIKGTTPDILLFDYRRVREDGTVIPSKTQIFDFSKKITNGGELFYGYKNNELRLWTSSLIYRRQFVMENSLKYLEGCHGSEDLNFIFKGLLVAKKVHYIDEVLSYYYQRSTSLTNKPNINKNITVIDAMENLCEFIKGKSLDLNIEAIIRNEFTPEHIMYQIFGCTRIDNKGEIIKVLKTSKVRRYLRGGKYNSTRYGKIVFAWMKLAGYWPNSFVRIYLKRKES